jgi:DNA-directed RNA polymerase subunit beta'
VDPLLGLKENVIIGKLVPAGTGMTRYRSVRVENYESEQKQENIPVEETDFVDINS